MGEGKRNRSRPKARWMDELMKVTGLSLYDLKEAETGPNVGRVMAVARCPEQGGDASVISLKPKIKPRPLQDSAVNKLFRPMPSTDGSAVPSLLFVLGLTCFSQLAVYC